MKPKITIEDLLEQYNEKGVLVDIYNNSVSFDELLYNFGKAMCFSACRIYLTLKIPQRGSLILNLIKKFSSKYYENWYNGNFLLFVQSILLVKYDCILFINQNPGLKISEEHLSESIMLGAAEYCHIMNLNKELENIFANIFANEINRIEDIKDETKISFSDIILTYKKYFDKSKKSKSRDYAKPLVSVAFKSHIGSLNLITFHKNYLKFIKDTT